MNESEQPTQPQPESEQPVTPDVTNILESLPPATLEALDALIKEGYGAIKVKRDLETRFGAVGNVLPASKSTYQRYIDKHEVRLEAERAAEETILNSLKEDHEVMADTTVNVLKGDKKSTKQGIDDLRRYYLNRIAYLEQLQTKGIPNTRIEQIIASYVKAYQTLLEMTVEYGEELNKETSNVLTVFLESVITEWIDASIGVYKKIHGNEKLTEFVSEMESTLLPIVKAQILEVEHAREEEGR
jgi:hypothetical protein